MQAAMQTVSESLALTRKRKTEMTANALTIHYQRRRVPQRKAHYMAALGAVAGAVRVAAVPLDPRAVAQNVGGEGAVVHAAVQVLKTKTRLVVAVLAVRSVAVMTNKDAVIEVCLTLAAMVAV